MGRLFSSAKASLFPVSGSSPNANVQSVRCGTVAAPKVLYTASTDATASYIAAIPVHNPTSDGGPCSKLACTECTEHGCFRQLFTVISPEQLRSTSPDGCVTCGHPAQATPSKSECQRGFTVRSQLFQNRQPGQSTPQSARWRERFPSTGCTLTTPPEIASCTACAT